MSQIKISQIIHQNKVQKNVLDFYVKREWRIYLMVRLSQ